MFSGWKKPGKPLWFRKVTKNRNFKLILYNTSSKMNNTAYKVFHKGIFHMENTA